MFLSRPSRPLDAGWTIGFLDVKLPLSALICGDEYQLDWVLNYHTITAKMFFFVACTIEPLAMLECIITLEPIN